MCSYHIRHRFVFKAVSLIQAVLFIFSTFALPVKGYAQTLAPVSIPGSLLQPSEAFQSAVLRGFKIDPQNPLLFDFIVDKGDTSLDGRSLQAESKKLIKYFLTALTVPSKDLWVNLSPYENDRIIAEKFGQTEMGRDLLEQDYILKQLTSSLMYPEADLGKAFWARVYERAQQEFGTTDLPIDTFNKVWIMPDTARVYEKGNNVYLVDAKMKVMLEQDYVALENNKAAGASPVAAAEQYGVSKFASDIVREVIVPEITREVNEGRNFAGLRQVHYSLVLAAWYERKVRQSILGKTFAGQNKIAGNEADDPQAKEKIYAQYVEAFKKGAYNYIKEDVDAYSKEPVARKYFSGGYKGDKAEIVDNSEPVGEVPQDKNLVAVTVNVGTTQQVVADAKPSAVEELTTTKFGLNDKGLDADEQKDLDIAKLDGLEEKGTVQTPAGEVKVLWIRDDMLGNLGYGFDRNNKAVVVSPQFITAAMEVLKDEQAVLDVVATEYFDGQKAAYELALQKLKPGVTKVSLFPYKGGTPEEMALSAEKEFDIPQQPVQADLEARAIEMDKDGRKIGAATMPSVVAPDGVIKEDPVMVNKIGREIAIKAAYAIGLRILLGLLEVLPVEKLEELSQLVRDGKSLTMMFMPSKWAPPTQAHSAFVFKVSALMAGVQPAGKFGKQTLAILPNVTKKDNRKPIIFTTYNARNGITHKMLSGLLGDSAKVLESAPLYEDKNGEETVVEIVTRLLIDYVNARGAGIKVPQVAGQINADLVAGIKKHLLLKGFLLRLLYQVGSDHYKTFSLSKAGLVNFGKITDGNREDQLYWARLNPLRYKQLIEDAGKMNDPALPDFNERKAFLDALRAAKDGEILALIEKATTLPLLDTIGKYTMASSLYGEATDLVLVHTFRGADYMADMGRDELIARHEVKVLNTDGFDAPVAATFVRQGLQELYLTGVFNYNKLGIVTSSVRSAILEDPQMIELLLRQDAEFNGDPKTFFPATPEIAMVAKSEQGTAQEEPIRKRKAALAVKHEIVGVQEAVRMNEKTQHWETQLMFNGAELVYKIGILYHPDGTPKNVYTEVFASDKDGALDRMRAYARELNAVDAAGTTDLPTGIKDVIDGGIDFDLNNVNMDVTSDGPGVQLNFDPAMLNNGNYNGLVPVIRSVTPIADLPMFLGAQKAAPALAGAAT